MVAHRTGGCRDRVEKTLTAVIDFGRRRPGRRLEMNNLICSGGEVVVIPRSLV